MKKLGRILHIVNLVLMILMAFHLCGTLILGWVFKVLFFDSIWYVLILCFTLGAERWVQAAGADSKQERLMTRISAALLTVAAVHMLLAGILQPISYHDDNLICTACIMDAMRWYILPVLIWAVVRLAVICRNAPRGQRLVSLMNLLVFIAWLGYTLIRWVEFVEKFGFGLYVTTGYYAGNIFVPILVLINVVEFLVRNVRETLQLPLE